MTPAAVPPLQYQRLVLLRGGGDLATGVAARLYRSGFRVVVTEIPQPLAVRRLVALAEAVFSGEVQIEEDLHGVLAEDPSTALHVLAEGGIPVLVDPDAFSRHILKPPVIVDARMLKTAPDLDRSDAQLVIGLGPGFIAGENCHVVIETNRGHRLGRVIRAGAAQADTAVPEAVVGVDRARVLRSPCDGVLKAEIGLGSILQKGALLAKVSGQEVRAPFDGALRGLVHDGVHVVENMKIGDLDPRGDREYCELISDKALSIGGGVLEAILNDPVLRAQLCEPCS
ncbi:MAG: EF2563 family selenium-dependent molybdenum hydroxylase system protein [Anaerolineales bacterium]|nr:EF2563 family selenium-dependent molybdenum hydroxylase system protein [Anaerolineales bacterium]